MSKFTRKRDVCIDTKLNKKTSIIVYKGQYLKK